MDTSSEKIEHLKSKLSTFEKVEVDQEQQRYVKQLHDLGFRFRNYKPKSQLFQPLVEENDISEETHKILSEAIEPFMNRIDDQVHLVAPMSNWDLKKSVESKLETMEKKTMRVLAEMLRDKMGDFEDNDEESSEEEDDGDEEEGESGDDEEEEEGED